MNKTLMPAEPDEQRLEFSNRKFLATPLSGLIIWTLVAIFLILLFSLEYQQFEGEYGNGFSIGLSFSVASIVFPILIILLLIIIKWLPSKAGKKKENKVES